jgi:hypothetical protein
LCFRFMTFDRSMHKRSWQNFLTKEHSTELKIMHLWDLSVQNSLHFLSGSTLEIARQIPFCY